ncbi:MAG: DNA polymerase III subunit delta [Candidatus Enteromonas sp.]
MQSFRPLGYNDKVIYLVYSEEPELARRSAMKLLKKEFPVRDETNYINLNFTTSSIKEIVDEVSFLPLGAESKAVFVENCTFLVKPGRAKPGTGSRKKKEKTVDADLAALAEYCKSPHANITLYLVAYSKDLDESNPVYQAVKNTGKICPALVPPRAGWIDFAQKFLKKYGSELNAEAAGEVVDRVDGDYGRFLGELAKLSIYANGEPVSTKTVETLVSRKLEDDTFVLSNALLKNDVASALSIYHDLNVHNVDEVRLLNTLASQIRFMDLVSFLHNAGMNKDSIARELSANPGRVGYTLASLRSVNPPSLKKILEGIYQTEKAILSGEEQPRFAFERFLANFQI